jgi:hypothetical protein
MQRSDSKHGGMPSVITITRTDKNLIWTLLPSDQPAALFEIPEGFINMTQGMKGNIPGH